MKHFARFILLFIICFALSGCFFGNDECQLLKDKPSLDSDIVCSCNQFFFTDSSLFLLYFDFASPDSYDPFRMNPYILYYDKDLTLQSSKWINALKILSLESDTIYVYERDSSFRKYKSECPRLVDKTIKYLSMPSKIDNVYNKVIESFQLDTLTMNVDVKYREYDDPAIGIRKSENLFFQDPTLPYTLKESIFKLSDLIFYPNYPSELRDNEIRYLHFTQDLTIDECLIFENPEIKQKFYADLCEYLGLATIKR